SGKGGNVVVWSSQSTDYAGAISAHGAGAGTAGGSGGNAEVSSHGSLTYAGSADLTAANGVKGNLLLDPDFIDIVGSGGNLTIPGSGTVKFNDPPTNGTLTAATLVAALSGSNITLESNNDITFDASVNAGSNPMFGNLTLRAGRSIIFNGDPTNNGQL